MGFLSALIEAKSVGNNLFHLVYNGDGPEDNFLYITSKGEGEEVIVSVSNFQSFHLKQPGYISGKSLLKSMPTRKPGRSRL